MPADSQYRIATLPAVLRAWLPRLGVFEQGAQETLLLAITGLGQVGPRPDLATGVTRDTWPRLRGALIAAGLLREEPVPGGGRPYLRFDPLLSAAAAAGLTPDQRDHLDRRHQRHYFQLTSQLVRQWRRDPAAALALVEKERPNLVKALNGAIAGGEDWAAEFLERLTPLFGALTLHAELTRWNEALAQRDGAVGSPAWQRRLSDRAERLQREGDSTGAAAALETLLAGLDPGARFERVATLGRLGRCRAVMGQAEVAIERFHEALNLVEDLDDTQAMMHMIADLHMDLGDGYRAREDLPAARAAYDAALAIYARNHEFPLAGHSAQRLVQVCEALGDSAAAHDFSRRARRLYGQSPRVHEALAAYAPFIEQVTAAATDPGRLAALEPLLVEGETEGWTAGIAAVRRILAGERDEDGLCAGLDLDDQQVVCAVLQALRPGGEGTDCRHGGRNEGATRRHREIPAPGQASDPC